MTTLNSHLQQKQHMQRKKDYSEMDNILPVDIVICMVVGKKSKIVPFEFTWSRYMNWSKIVYDIQVTI